ncbi:MAG: two-component sensor histidine kinase [Kamptonema sp. SIO1D9]|nr:two-component sensor histidine kinase [Kamptonema sp. SIO1D9]
MNSYQLFRHSRLRLACWYVLAMGMILGLSGLGMYRFLVQSKWRAMEREMESIAGTLHDSLEPMLPASEDPTTVLQRILPELCLAGQPCQSNVTLIQRHTTGISDRSTYYLRLFDAQGQLLAFSPNQPRDLSATLNPDEWQTLRNDNGSRYHQFTIILHSANGSYHLDKTNWGYLQIGRTLKPFDAEVRRIRWILVIGFPLALGVVAVSGWWLSGLAMQPIYQSYQQQQQFTANAAHELRSPLASLLATVEATLRVSPENSSDLKTMLGTIERQGRRLSALITDLLFLTSLEYNSSASETFQPCCLNNLISDLSEEFSEFANLAEVDLTHQIPQDEVYVLGNESQLYRLVSNLIANGIQYTLKGGQVKISLHDGERTALITIEDTGIGIPATEQRRIFERFYRVDRGRVVCRRHRATGGTGLGLAIAQAIVQHHQGYLTVKSEVNRGSLFTIHLRCVHSRKCN